MGNDAANVIDLSEFRYFGDIFKLNANANINACVNTETIMFPEGATFIGPNPYVTTVCLTRVSLAIFPSTMTGMMDNCLRYLDASNTNPVYILLGNKYKPSLHTTLGGGKGTIYVRDRYFNEFYEYYNHNSRIKPLSQWDGVLPWSYRY